MKRSIVWLFSLLLIASFAFAGDGEMKSDKAMKSGKEMTFEGKMVCTFCDLKSEGARSNCKAFGHQHGLKTKEGKYISLLANQYSNALVNDEAYANKDLKVTGTYFADAAVLDVTSFEVDGKKMTWCDHHKAMDGCAAGM